MESTSDFLRQLVFTDGVGLLALAVAVLVVVVGFVRWCVGKARTRTEEARLVTSHFRFVGMG
ncbi:hypothetical protein GCM10027404_32620 [Arthrobacter tumbae]